MSAVLEEQSTVEYAATVSKIERDTQAGVDTLMALGKTFKSTCDDEPSVHTQHMSRKFTSSRYFDPALYNEHRILELVGTELRKHKVHKVFETLIERVTGDHNSVTISLILREKRLC